MKNQIESIIIDRLLTDINHGKYCSNEKLPSENELADYYKVSRMSIRKAYLRLQEMGYIYSKQGKGRFLKDRHQLIELILSGDQSFTKKMSDKGYKFASQNIFCEKIPYNNQIFNELRIRKDDEVYKIGRVRIVESRPIALHVSYVAKSVFQHIPQEGNTIESMFDYYKSKGYKKFESEKTILSISFPHLLEREILCCSELIPLLIVETNCIDSVSKKVLEYTKIQYRGDSFKYIVK